MYLIYEKSGGRVVGQIDRTELPPLQSHHDAIAVTETYEDITTLYVMDGEVERVLPMDYLDSAKAKVARAITAARDAHLDAGALTPLGRVQADTVSRTNISGAVSLAMLEPDAFAITWRLADNSEVELTAAQMIAVGKLVAQFTNQTYQRSFELKAQLDALTTLEDVRAFAITF